MKQFEQPLEARLADLERSGRAACRFLYTELTLHHFFGSDFEVRDRIEHHAGFGTVFWGRSRRPVFSRSVAFT